MKRAAIIVYGNNSNRLIFWVLGRPYEAGKINMELGKETYELFILEVPNTKENKYKIKQRRIIEKFCGENNIRPLFYIDDKDEELDSIWYSIKILCILREIEIIIGKGVYNRSFGIVTNALNKVLLEAISEEASSILILKTGLDEIAMEELYKKIMQDKGLSIAFVDDVKFLINQSEILLWESKTPISPSINVEKVLLFSQQADHSKPDTILMKYKEEIAKAIIRLASDMNIWEMTSCFPFVYFLDEGGNYLSNEQIRRLLARSNKPLTIQKC